MAFLDFKAGVFWKDITPFTSTGYILGSGAKVDNTYRTPLAEKQVQSKSNTTPSAKKGNSPANNGPKQTTLYNHFSPTKSPCELTEVILPRICRNSKEVEVDQTRDVIDLTQSDSINGDFDDELDEFLMFDKFVDDDKFSATKDIDVVSSNNSGAISYVTCSICAIKVSVHAINSHIDTCLN